MDDQDQTQEGALDTAGEAMGYDSPEELLPDTSGLAEPDLGNVAYARREYEAAKGKSEASFQEVLNQINAAKQRLLAQPTELTRQQYLRGLASKLTTPPERTDPRFYERRNLYTFLRDVGQYGAEQEAAQKAAKLKQAEEAGKLDQLIAKYGLESAQKREAQAAALLGKAREGTAMKEDELTRLQRIRSTMDVRTPEYREITRRINYLGGERDGDQAQVEPMQKVFDKKVAEDLAEWTVGGEGARSRSRQSTLLNAAKELKSGKEVTGPMIGFFIENYPTLSAATSAGERALNTKDLVEGVIQQDLRAILGGQFAEREGAGLLKRAYNPRISEEKNAARLELFVKQIARVADLKDKAYEWFSKNKTMAGFPLPSYNNYDFLTEEQLKLLDAGLTPDEVLSGKKAGAPAKPAAPAKSAAPAAPSGQETPEQRAAAVLAKRRAAQQAGAK